jgi:hypothetical protein
MRLRWVPHQDLRKSPRDEWLTLVLFDSGGPTLAQHSLRGVGQALRQILRYEDSADGASVVMRLLIAFRLSALKG